MRLLLWLSLYMEFTFLFSLYVYGYCLWDFYTDMWLYAGMLIAAWFLYATKLEAGFRLLSFLMSRVKAYSKHFMLLSVPIENNNVFK